MKQDIKILAKLLGEVLYLLSFFHIVPSIVGLISLAMFQDIREMSYITMFASISLILMLLGRFLKRIDANLDKLKIKPYLIAGAVGLAWLIVPFLGGIIYYYTGLSPVDSMFESMSAWTTTGFTAYNNVTDLSYSVKFWRSFEQWIGGLGIIVFLVFMISKNSLVYDMVRIEGREDFIEPTAKHTLIKMMKLYVSLTFIGAALLSFAGMDIFTASNISMTALATGGMTPFTQFSPTAIQQAIIILLMLAGALNFAFHAMVFEGRIKKAFKRYEPLKWFIALISISGIIGIVNGINPLSSFFHSVSAITCSGFGYDDLAKKPEAYIFSLIALMIIGGGIGSTAGGIKIDRFIILVKGIKLQLRKILHPRDMSIVERYMNSIIDEKVLAMVGVFFFSYVSTLFISSILLTFHTKDFVKSMFEVASAMGNVGLELNIVSSLPAIYKILLIIDMWLGRLEIFAAFALILSLYKIIRD